MPINSFENYNMTWKPNKTKLKSPMHIELANMLEKDILTGNLSSGTKLPPQRELADFLDISLSTVTRVYTTCEKRGLIHAITGNGTFVSEAANVSKTIISGDNTIKNIEFGVAAPFYNHNVIAIEAVRRVVNSPEINSFFEYTNPLGTEKQISAAIQWLKLFGINAEQENTLITNGTQNALNIILSSLFEAGDRIAVDQYTYANFIGLANMLHISLLPVESDENGMSAQKLQKLCNNNSITGIYLSPSCSNPQAICMPEKRRKEIADIIRENNIILIEDDPYAFLIDEKKTPISCLVSSSSIYISGLGKSVCAGLRIAYMCFSSQYRKKLEAAIYNCNLTTSPLNAEIATEMIFHNEHMEIMKKNRSEVIERNKIYAEYFDNTNYNSYYQWLSLPHGITGIMFEAIASNQGINVYSSERFLTGDAFGKFYIRISTSAPKTAEDLHRGLSKIKNILAELKTEFFQPSCII